MSRYYDFFCPVKLLAGEQALEQLASELASLGARRPLLLTDKGDGLWECLVRPGRKLKPGAQVSFGEGRLTGTGLLPSPERWTDLLQAWLEMEVQRRSDRAEDLLNRLQSQPLNDEEQLSANLLRAMVSFNFDHLECAIQQLGELKDLPQPMLAPYRLTQASCLLYTGQTQRARNMLELLVSWADCQQQYHLKLVGWYRLAQLHFYQGDWQQCSKVLQLGVEFANQHQLTTDPVFDSYYRLQAELAIYQGQADQADYWLQQGTPLMENRGDYWQLPYLSHRCLTLVLQIGRAHV